jgi:ABC-type dipeptide/oligopeptide/nickel transport system ATPase component
VATVAGIDIALGRGETLGLVGESGSGKSTILKSIAGLLPPRQGRIALRDQDDLPPRVEDRDPRHLRDVQLIFQNPDESLNPRQTIGQILQWLYDNHTEGEDGLVGPDRLSSEDELDSPTLSIRLLVVEGFAEAEHDSGAVGWGPGRPDDAPWRCRRGRRPDGWSTGDEPAGPNLLCRDQHVGPGWDDGHLESALRPSRRDRRHLQDDATALGPAPRVAPWCAARIVGRWRHPG